MTHDNASSSRWVYLNLLLLTCFLRVDSGIRQQYSVYTNVITPHLCIVVAGASLSQFVGGDEHVLTGSSFMKCFRVPYLHIKYTEYKHKNCIKQNSYMYSRMGVTLLS